MDENRFLDITEAAHFLNITEQQVKDLVRSGQLDAYQIGGMFLRFKLRQLENFKNRNQAGSEYTQRKQSAFSDSIRDFFYFNDFYLIAVLFIVVLLFIILKNIS